MANNNLKNPIKSTPAELSIKIRKLKHIYDLPRIDIESNIAVQERIDYYFEYSMSQGLKPNIEGLALAIGISRATLWDWETGRSRAQVDSSRSDIIKKAKDFIAFLMSNEAMDGNINPITWIFYAKNYFGMKDVQEISVSASSALGDQLSADEIARRLPQDIPIDIECND